MTSQGRSGASLSSGPKPNCLAHYGGRLLSPNCRTSLFIGCPVLDGMGTWATAEGGSSRDSVLRRRPAHSRHPMGDACGNNPAVHKGEGTGDPFGEMGQGVGWF